MAYLLTTLHNAYLYAMKELADPRVESWFLMDSLKNIILIQVIYVYVVQKLGPNLMANRKPFNIDNLLIVYNFAQMLINAYITFTIVKVVFKKYNVYCNEIDYSDDPDALSVLTGLYMYFLTKILDLLDTVFFVLRKKDKQVTFLHVYHHCMMVLFTWIGAKFLGGGHSAYAPLINSFVHVCMYGYYLLSVWDKSVKSSIWWKRHITELQLLQFMFGAFLLVGPIVVKDCKYPYQICIPIFVQDLFFVSLFGDFYLKTYVYTKGNTKSAQYQNGKLN